MVDVGDSSHDDERQIVEEPAQEGEEAAHDEDVPLIVLRVFEEEV